MEFTPPKKALVDMIYSMIDKGVLPKESKNYSGISKNAIIVLYELSAITVIRSHLKIYFRLSHFWDKCVHSKKTVARAA